MPFQRLQPVELRYLEGWAVKAAVQLRERGEVLKTRSVRLLMAKDDEKCRRIFDNARHDPGAKDALRKLIERAIKPIREAERPPAPRPRFRLDRITRYAEPDKSWVKWLRRLVPGAPLVAFAAVLCFLEPLAGALLLAIFSAFWVLVHTLQSKDADEPSVVVAEFVLET